MAIGSMRTDKSVFEKKLLVDEGKKDSRRLLNGCKLLVALGSLGSAGVARASLLDLGCQYAGNVGWRFGSLKSG